MDFLKDYLRGKTRDDFVLKNRSVRRSRDGTYDFDRPVAEYMAEMGFPEFYPHSMRHSWITELVNSGNHTLQEVSAWSGDGLDTIERTYWKKRVVAGSIDVTLRGEKKEARTERQIDDIKEILEMLLAGKVDQAKVATESAGPKVKSALKKWLGEVTKNSEWVYDVD